MDQVIYNLIKVTQLSISKFFTNAPYIEHLVFHDIKEDFAIKQINKINIKKATGRDSISAQI